MEIFFVRLINMSISAGLLIFAVIILRLVLHKAPKWIVCILWSIVAVQLVIPMNFHSEFSVHRITAPSVLSDNGMEYVYYSNTPEKPRVILDKNRYFYPERTEEGADETISEKTHNPDLYLPPIMEIWMCGMAVMLFYAVYSMAELRKNLEEAVLYKDNIWMSDTVGSPFVLGIIHPRIYVCSATPENRMEYVIAHEQAHLKRRDHWWKLLGYLILCVHWFNPLCWAAYILFCRDIEFACDEKVIRDRNLSWKKNYSAVLLESSLHGRTAFSCPLAFGEVGAKERIKAILKYKKPAAWMGAMAVIACIVMAVCFLTVPPKKPQNEEFMYSDSAEEEGIVQNTQPDVQEITSHYFFYSEPEEDMVCIRLQPSFLRERADCYYIPEENIQKELIRSVSGLDEPWERDELFWQGIEETGWTLLYHGTVYRVFKGGYFYHTENDAEGELKEYIKQDEALYQLVNEMLEEIGYVAIDVNQIKDIAAAKLEIQCMRTDNEHRTYTITDKEVLAKFEKWFSEAEYIFGGADCGNQYACLELTLEDGKVINLSLATDDCPNFGINGVYYDYRPTEYRKKGGWYSDILFRYFDENLAE